MNLIQRGILRLYHLWMLVISQCLFLKVACQTSFSDISLSSPDHCVPGKINEVGILKGYLIQPVKTGHVKPSFIDCKVTFQSERVDGRICLSQEGKHAGIQDRNAQLIAYDGNGTSDQDSQVFRIEYGPDKWSKREYCTTSRSLYMHLEMKDPTKATNITELHMQFKVQDIQSKDRIFYLEDDYCDKKYELENSQITIMNRLPYNSPMPVRKVKDLCLMELERKEMEKLRTCIVYIPSEKEVSCGKDGWEFWVSYDKDNALDPDYHVHARKCEKSVSDLQHMYAWCAKNTSNSIYFYLSRNNVKLMSNSSEEPPGMFGFVVADYSGSEDELMELIKMQQKMKKARELGPSTDMPKENSTERLKDSISGQCPITKSSVMPTILLALIVMATIVMV